MKHSTEPWGYIHNLILTNDDYVIAYDVSVHDCKRITECVNAMEGIADPVAWVAAAKEMHQLMLSQCFPTELGEAWLDMKAAEDREWTALAK